MPATAFRRANAAIDQRFGKGTQKFLRNGLDHIFPDNWSFMLGEVALYLFILLVGSGIFLTVYFDPSDTTVIYHGSYTPLYGQSMSSAYRSVVDLSFNVRAGLFFRQVHHWSADLFLAAIVAHMCRIFFTGAFRKPRELNWMVGLTLLALSIFNGFTGYSLPGDTLSGIGLRIAYTILESIPVVGNWAVFLAFGGQFPSNEVTHRLYIAHVFLVPLVLLALIGLHLAMIWRQKHTQFPGTGRSEKRLVGSQLWPTYTGRSIGLFCFIIGAVALLAGFAQIDPIWLYGYYHPYISSSAAQPDWYVGWLEGTLRLFPRWHLHILGYTVTDAFWPAALFPAAVFAFLYAYPFLERWWTSDYASHNVLDRPRDRPGRTAFGAANLAFFIILIGAGAQDLIAAWLGDSMPPVTLTLRGMAITVPAVVFVITWWTCRSLQAADRRPRTEPPQGPADSATPPKEQYLPPRARFEHQQEAAEAVSANGNADGTEGPSGPVVVVAPGTPTGVARRAVRALRVGGAAASSVVAAYIAGKLRSKRRRGATGAGGPATDGSTGDGIARRRGGAGPG